MSWMHGIGRVWYFFAPFYEPPKQSSKFQHQNIEAWPQRWRCYSATAFEKLSREVVPAVDLPLRQLSVGKLTNSVVMATEICAKFISKNVSKIRWGPRDSTGNSNPQYFITSSWDDKVFLDRVQCWECKISSNLQMFTRKMKSLYGTALQMRIWMTRFTSVILMYRVISTI